jgi:signal peptidase I
VSEEGLLDPPLTPLRGPEAPAEPVRRTAPTARAWRRYRPWVLLIATVATLSILVRAFAIQSFYIPTGSMEPTLWPGQGIVVNKLAVEFGTIHTGDVVVFHASAAVAQDCSDATADLVKRVIGLPGQTLYSEGSTIYVDSRPLRQDWAHYEPLNPAIGSPEHPIVVPAGNYFVLGDNQPSSCDSRYWGFVPRSAMIGTVFFRVWPLSAFGGI